VARSAWRLVAVIVLLAAEALPAIGQAYAAITVPRLSDLDAKADVIVVLGGETTARVGEAVTLFTQGMGARVLVSGAGDCVQNKSQLVAAGIPPKAILVDCASHSTWQNATNASGILRALRARRAILVTSWFHGPRASICFEKLTTGIRYFLAPVHSPDERLWSLETAQYLLSEYIKSAWYMVRYGATPLDLHDRDAENRGISTSSGRPS
jgi:uncharacterized SAM-binding protein YcdF (DUF218 family)